MSRRPKAKGPAPTEGASLAARFASSAKFRSIYIRFLEPWDGQRKRGTAVIAAGFDRWNKSQRRCGGGITLPPPPPSPSKGDGALEETNG